MGPPPEMGPKVRSGSARNKRTMSFVKEHGVSSETHAEIGNGKVALAEALLYSES